MKKKIVVLMLAMTLTGAMFLTACGEKEQASNKDGWEDELDDEDDKDEDDEEDYDDEDEDVVDSSEDEDTADEDTDDEDTDDEVTDDTVEGERGTITDGVFTNNVFKISFPITDDMHVFTDDELLQAIGGGADLVDANGVFTAEQMEKATSGTLYDTMISMSDEFSNVIISYENMDLTIGMRVTEEQYAQALTMQLGQMTYPKYSFEEPEWVTLAGEDYLKLAATTDVGLSQDYYVRVVDNYVVGIIYTTAEGSEQMRDDFFDSFIEVE